MVVAYRNGKGKTISFTVPVLVDAALDTFMHVPLAVHGEFNC